MRREGEREKEPPAASICHSAVNVKIYIMNKEDEKKKKNEEGKGRDFHCATNAACLVGTAVGGPLRMWGPNPRLSLRVGHVDCRPFVYRF